jgi:hypothetical protein
MVKCGVLFEVRTGFRIVSTIYKKFSEINFPLGAIIEVNSTAANGEV